MLGGTGQVLCAVRRGYARSEQFMRSEKKLYAVKPKYARFPQSMRQARNRLHLCTVFLHTLEADNGK